MVCPKCGSNNINVQVVNEIHLKDAHHGFFWWIFVGWWWVPIKWICFTVPAIIAKMVGYKKQKTSNKQKTICVCQNCGYSWKTK